MKKFLFVFVLSLVSFVSINAQNICIKFGSDATYYKIENRNGKFSCFKINNDTFNDSTISIFNAYKDNKIKENSYIPNFIYKRAILPEYQLIGDSAIISDNIQITINENKPVEDLYDSTFIECQSKEIIKSKTKYQSNQFYKLFTVTNSYNKNYIGCDVICKILDRRKSNLSGSEGRIVISPLFIDYNGQRIYLDHTPIIKRGKNRTNVKAWLSGIAFPLYYIAGQGAKIKTDEKIYIQLK